MPIAETLSELITTTNQIAEIRRQQRPWANAAVDVHQFLISAGEQLRHADVIAAIDGQVTRLRQEREDEVAAEHNSTLADLLEQEAEAILAFHNAVLQQDPGARAPGNGREQRPLKRALKMMDTFMGSLLDLFGDLMPTWAKASIIVWREAASLVID